MEEISLYVHIPFCKQKCNYCAFASFCRSEKEMDEYVDFLCKEIRSRKCDKVVKTIYIGGGTPSTLNQEQITKIVSAIYNTFDVYDNAEFTIEANPNSISEPLLITWKNLRVNRVSVGVQSLNDKTLKKIGRLHNRAMALEKLKLVRHYFDNVSADLIVGLENESGKDLCRYAKEILSLGVKHISCYLLEVYENTPMYKMISSGAYKPLDDDQTIDSFEKLSHYLIDLGMERYEISNFAFEGYESKHNLNYWCRGEYLGFGLGAHSFENGVRYANDDTFEGYYAGKKVSEQLTVKEEIEEIIMLGLRCKLGVDIKTINQMGYDIQKNESYIDYIKQGVLTQQGDKIFLNPLFYHISNTIISNLMP
ncbi:MAG: radical SAM family heme chaperone HemW [Clostridia bacterium]|nr:radical SAM family heme chaperone HemW [Clostridia bacterium]